MSERKHFYITTPIFYPNNKLHLGHAYTMTIVDIIARYKKMLGFDVYLQTGSDEHGEKIAKTASSNGITPQQLVDQNIITFKHLWAELNVLKSHFFMRTSFSSHKEEVQSIFEKLLNQGDIYLDKYRGSYCVVCEEHVVDSQTCSSCCSTLKKIEEDAYFLRVEKYRTLLIDYYKDNPNFLSPDTAVNELFQSFLKNQVPDLCITRNDLKWGIPVPYKPEMTIYVWFDALCNYLTSAQGANFFSPNDSSSEIVHVFGKDILRFHAVYWIILLFILKKRIPNKLISHGWVLSSGNKMSKSKGNTIDPLDLLKNYESDVLRAYFAAKIAIYQDGLLDEKLLESFYQDFFLNNLGNLFSRCCGMLKQYANNVIPAFTKSTNQLLIEYHKRCLFSVKEYERKMNIYQLTSAFNEIQTIIDISNKLISKIVPWKLFSDKKFSLLRETLLHLFNAIKIVAFLLLPITPQVSERIFLHLKINSLCIDFKNISDFRNIEKRQLENLVGHLFVKKK